MQRRKLIRVTTVPLSLKYLLKGQLKYFKEKGYQVVAISSDGPEIADFQTEEQVPHRQVKFTRQITPIQDIIALFVLCRIFYQEKPDIVHTHTPKAGMLGMLAAWIIRIPVRMHTVAGLPLMEAQGVKRELLLFAEKLTYRSASMVYPNSKALRSYILQNIYKDKHKLKVIASGSSNGINIDHFSPNESLQEQAAIIRKELSIGEEETVTVFVGRLTRDKGVNELVSVIADLKDIHLILVGPFEPELDPLDELSLKEIESNPRIHHVGFQKDVRPYLLAADFLTFPSYREGFPNVPMQAGAMRLPSIVTDINGCNEIVSHEENGLLIVPKDEDSLKYAIERMRNDVNLFEIMKGNARPMITNRFEHNRVWEAIAKEYETQLNAHVSQVL